MTGRYDKASPEACTLLEQFDEFDLAEMLVTAQAALGQAEEAARRALAQRQKMAAERHAWQERGDRAEATLARVRDFLDQDQDGLCCSHATGQLRSLLDGTAATEATEPEDDPTHGLTVQQADTLWDAVAIPGPRQPTFMEQHDRVRRAVSGLLAEATAVPEPVVLTEAEEARLATTGIDTPGCDCGHPGMGVSWHGDDCPWRQSVLDGSTPAPGCSPDAAETEPNNTAPASLRDQYTDAVECAIGLNVNCGGTEGVHRVRDAVLNVRDREMEQLRQRLALAEYFHQDIASVQQRADRYAATLDRVRDIPRLPHSSQQTGELGRAYTRGWESVINALDAALNPTQEPTS